MSENSAASSRPSHVMQFPPVRYLERKVFLDISGGMGSYFHLLVI